MKVFAEGDGTWRASGGSMHSDRELRQQLMVLNAKIERLSGVDLEEGDNWSAWMDLLQLFHLMLCKVGQELIAPELRLDKRSQCPRQAETSFDRPLHRPGRYHQ